jgi:hypothetical protein
MVLAALFVFFFFGVRSYRERAGVTLPMIALGFARKTGVPRGTTAG